MNNSIQFDKIFANLIAFNTISLESNLACVDYIEEFLMRFQFRTKKFYNDNQTKANLIASIGPQTTNGIILAGHTDVVPIAGQDWKSDPFQLITKDSCYYGRGTADMKGFIALALEIASLVKINKLQYPLHLVFTYDEEIGCGGAKALQNEIAKYIEKPRFMLIGEPTDLNFVTAHKGIQVTHTMIRGKSAHSSDPEFGANAIIVAAKLIYAIRSLIPKNEDNAFSPPQTTYNIGTIQGGSAVNIIAEHCEFDWEIRPLPKIDITHFNTQLKDSQTAIIQKNSHFKIDNHVKANVPGLLSGNNLDIVEQLNRFLPNSKVITAAFVTEAGLYQATGIPAIVCGPGHIHQAHQPNEYVSKKNIETYRKFLLKILDLL